MDSGAENYRRFLDGDDDGIVEIIKDYKDGLILYLNKFVNNIFVSEELMEETFFKLVTKKPRFSGKSSFKTYLYTVGRNVAIDYLRKNSKRVDMSDEILEKCISNEESLENSYIKEERKIQLHQVMEQLNPDYAQSLYLIYFENFSNSEAAEIMKKSRRQFENLIYRAKASLSEKLEREGFTYEIL